MRKSSYCEYDHPQISVAQTVKQGSLNVAQKLGIKTHKYAARTHYIVGLIGCSSFGLASTQLLQQDPFPGVDNRNQLLF